MRAILIARLDRLVPVTPISRADRGVVVRKTLHSGTNRMTHGGTRIPLTATCLCALAVLKVVLAGDGLARVVAPERRVVVLTAEVATLVGVSDVITRPVLTDVEVEVKGTAWEGTVDVRQECAARFTCMLQGEQSEDT